MELVGIENSQVIHLTQMHRLKGQVYQPDISRAAIERYSFAKSPTLEDLSSNVQTYGIGKFGDVQIQEMSLYNDGLIVSSRSNTKIIDAFLDDVLSWVTKEFEIVPLIINKPERYYESHLIVKSKIDLISVLNPSSQVLNAFNQVWENRYDAEYKFVSFNFDCGPQKFSGRRKPIHFGIERRVGISFDENVFFATAPLSTDSHLALLTKLEALGTKDG